MSTLRDPSANLEPLRPGDPPAPMGPGSVRSLNGKRGRIFFHVDLVRSLSLHRIIAIGIFVLGLLLAVAYVIRMWPTYVARSQVYVQPPPPRAVDQGEKQHWPFDDNSNEGYMQQQVRNISRPEVLLGALRQLPATSWKHADESEQSAAERLGRTLKVNRIGSSYQISIASRASSRFLAAQIANAVAESFIERARQDPRAGDPQRVELLRDERDRIQKELAADRDEQADLNKLVGAAAAEKSAANPYEGQIGQLHTELARARAESDAAAARLMAMDRTDANSAAALDAQANILIAADAGLVSMKTSLSQRRDALISQMANLRPDQPLYKQDSDELAQVNASLDSMMRDVRSKAATRIQESMRGDLERTSALEAQLNIQMARLTVAAGTPAPRLQRLNDLATDIRRLQDRYSAVDEQFHILSTERREPGAAYISTLAVPPAHSSKLGAFLNAGLMVLGGLLFSVIGAVAAHNLDPRVYIATDVERVLGHGPMAQLPDFGEVPEPVAEELLRRLAAALEHAYQQGTLKSCMFTGAAAGVGVTTLTNQVKAKLDAMGRPSVLVDASGTALEAHAPGTPEIVKAQPSAPLEKTAADADGQTIVFTDGPPLLVSSEVVYLAPFVDTVIVVIEAGTTTRGQLREIAQTLRQLNVSSVGFVLNRIPLGKADPSFRGLIQGVEKHLKTQSRLHGRQPERQGPHEAEHTGSKSHAKEMPAPSAGTAAEPAARQKAQTSREKVREREAAPPSTEASAPSNAGNTGSHPMRGRGEPNRGGISNPSKGKAYTREAASETDQPRERSRTAPREVRRDGAVASSANPRGPEERNLPAARTVEAVPMIHAETVPDLDDDLPYSASSRLGSLRNLMVATGLKSLHYEAEVRGKADLDKTRKERAAGEVLHEDSYPADVHEDELESEHSPVHLVAQPEFLPPRQMIEVEREKEPLRTVPTPVKNDAADDIETLPSWRGQYRKKRFK